MMPQYLVWVTNQVGSGACKEDRDPIAESSDSPAASAVYLQSLIFVRR
jgi:hypothetical protein